MTAVFMDHSGDFVKVLPLPEKLTPEVVLKLMHSHPDFAMVLKPKGEYSAAELKKWQRETVRGFDVLQSGKLPTGWRHL